MWALARNAMVVPAIILAALLMVAAICIVLLAALALLAKISLMISHIPVPDGGGTSGGSDLISVPFHG